MGWENQVHRHIHEIRKARAGWVERASRSNWADAEALQMLANIARQIDTLKHLLPVGEYSPLEPSLGEVAERNARWTHPVKPKLACGSTWNMGVSTDHYAVDAVDLRLSTGALARLQSTPEGDGFLVRVWAPGRLFEDGGDNETVLNEFVSAEVLGRAARVVPDAGEVNDDQV